MGDSAHLESRLRSSLILQVLHLVKDTRPVFMGQNPPEPNPNFRLLTGSFVAMASAANGNALFGGVARHAI